MIVARRVISGGGRRLKTRSKGFGNQKKVGVREIGVGVMSASLAFGIYNLQGELPEEASFFSPLLSCSFSLSFSSFLPLSFSSLFQRFSSDSSSFQSATELV